MWYLGEDEKDKAQLEFLARTLRVASSTGWSPGVRLHTRRLRAPRELPSGAEAARLSTAEPQKPQNICPSHSMCQVSL